MSRVGWAVVAALLLMLAGWARAATLQISPVTLDLPADESAAGITLRNPGAHSLYGQVRIFRWDQAGGRDVLTPTTELVASPPLIRIKGRAEQLVRLIRPAPAPAGERSYRILIDELVDANDTSQSGIMIRLRYSVPVFVEPAGVPGAPKLSWHLHRDEHGWLLRVDNTGNRRARISAIQLVATDGKIYDINRGLLGYALAGHRGQWRLPLPHDARLGQAPKVQAAVNAVPIEAVIDRDVEI